MLSSYVNFAVEISMALWMAWWEAINLLRPAFSRLRSFLWFVTTVAGLTVRTEHLGVTSIVRALKLQPRLYNKCARTVGAYWWATASRWRSAAEKCPV
jgi:hypothetical protein